MTIEWEQSVNKQRKRGGYFNILKVESVTEKMSGFFYGRAYSFVRRGRVCVFSDFFLGRSYCASSPRADLCRQECTFFVAEQRKYQRKSARTFPPGPPFPCHAAQQKTRFDSASEGCASNFVNTRGRRNFQGISNIVERNGEGDGVNLRSRFMPSGARRGPMSSRQLFLETAYSLSLTGIGEFLPAVFSFFP